MRGDICRKKGCSQCCRGTEMPLTEKDKQRIRSAGHSDFYHEESSRLRNVKGRCFFLTEEGTCSIYEIRPEGCRLYPLIMALPSRRPLMDEDCPFHDLFTVEQGELQRLEELISTLEKEGRA